MSVMQKSYIAIIMLIIIIGIGLDYIVYQKKIIVEQNINLQELSGQIEAITAEKEEIFDKIASLNEQIGILDTKILGYLDAENRECNKDTASCLDELTAKLRPTELRCEPLSDGVCPPFCGLSLDYDCCIEKGYKWIQGQGCYS